jgi:short-subunit dehydrogenase
MAWAFIAGGSKGLGRSLAEALAKRKFNLLLIARNQSELEAVRDELERRYPVQVEILSADLSTPESIFLIHAWCVANKFEIKVFCYAAGLGGSKDFQNLPLEDVRKMIRVNLDSAVALTYLMIPLLKQTVPSHILFIGSLAGFAPLTVKAVYAASKSALHSFAFSLRQMTKADQISVSCACPGPLFTKDSIEKETIRQLGWIGKQMAVKPADAGEIMIRNMLKGHRLIIPGKLATFFSWMLRLFPDRLIARISY